MQIIYEINAELLDRARRSGRRRSDGGAVADRRASGRRVRMGNLAFVGSHKINGVSALHTELMRKTMFRD